MNNPSAEQKKWMGTVAAIGCIVTGSSACQIHHVAGRAAKQNKVPIGHAYILPLHHINHSYIDQGVFGLEKLKMEAIERYDEADTIGVMRLHEFELYLFGKVLRRTRGNWPPFLDEQMITAISGWHR